MHQNIAGAINKIEDIIFVLSEFSQNRKEIDVICLTETFIKKGTERLLKIPGYTLVASYSRNSKRGGSCILTKSCLDCRSLSSVNDLSCNFSYECTGIELTTQKIVILCIYRTPNSNPNEFLEKLEQLLFRLTKRSLKIIICGDWNINTLKPSKSCQDLVNLLKNFNIELHIKSPTRHLACLDQFASNMKQVIAEVHHLGLSDHETGQTLSVKINKKRKLINWHEQVRDYSEENVKKFCHCISSITFSEMYNKNNFNAAFQEFHELFALFFDLCFPIFIVKKSNRKNNISWLTKGLKKSCVRKRYLYLKHKQFGAKKRNKNKIYREYNSILKKCMRKSRELQNNKYINNNKNKCKAVWEVINSNIGDIKTNTEIDKILYNNNTYSDSIDICEAFNNYYIQLTNDTNFKFDINDINKTIDVNNQNTIFLRPTYPDEIFKVINSLNNTNSVGIDGINTKLIKTCATFISEPLSYLVNMSLEQGIFPELLKSSIVKPLFKKGDVTNMSNYRPVTLIPVFSKIFEKIMLKRLHDFAISQEILSHDQFGFRKNSTTSLACFNLIKIITEAINENTPVTAIFLDMSKAFDYVDHKLLLFKLDKYGIRGKANDWIKSYLTDRNQCVEISKLQKNNKIAIRSKFQGNNFGVPQGSVLGPFLFLIYINDLPNVTNHKTVLFADDTTVIVKCNDKSTYESEITITLDKIINWLTTNNLKINVEKTKMIQFQTYRRKPLHLNINHDGKKIEEVSSTKFLGLLLDQNCDWKRHIDYVCDKLDRFVFAIKRLRTTVSVEAALCAYHGYVSSVLSYGLLLWGNSVDFVKAFRVQKKCVRAICGTWFMDSCKPLFKKLRILPLACMYIRELCVFVKQYPQYFQNQAQITNRNTRYKYRLYLPQCKLELYRRNAFINAIKVYNKLPNEFKDLCLNIFKRKLTLWLLQKCFYDLNEFMTYKE